MAYKYHRISTNYVVNIYKYHQSSVHTVWKSSVHYKWSTNIILSYYPVVDGGSAGAVGVFQYSQEKKVAIHWGAVKGATNRVSQASDRIS